MDGQRQTRTRPGGHHPQMPMCRSVAPLRFEIDGGGCGGLRRGGCFPWAQSLGGFSLGLLFRNQIAAQQRNEHLRKGGCLLFGGSAFFFGGLAFEFDGELEERDAAEAQLVDKGFGNLLLALVHGREQGLGKVAARPDGGERFFGFAGLVADAKLGRGVVRAELVCSVFGVFFVVHARSLPQKSERDAALASRLGKNHSLNSE
jgi:hypothetical protein